MDKPRLLKQIILTLEAVQKNALDAFNHAHNTATHEENVAENKYDTLGLEASYLAHGQAKRLAECEADLIAYQALTAKTYSPQDAIALGAFIILEDESEIERHLFLGPAAGGLKLEFEDQPLVLVTPSSPLGKALLGRHVDDAFEITVGAGKKHYEIIDLS